MPDVSKLPDEQMKEIKSTIGVAAMGVSSLVLIVPGAILGMANGPEWAVSLLTVVFLIAGLVFMSQAYAKVTEGYNRTFWNAVYGDSS